MLYSQEYLQAMAAERLLEAENQRRARQLKAARRDHRESRGSRLAGLLRRIAFADAPR